MGWSKFLAIVALLYIAYYTIIILKDLLTSGKARQTHHKQQEEFSIQASPPPVKVLTPSSAPEEMLPTGSPAVTKTISNSFNVDLAYERASYSGGVWVSEILATQKISV